MKIEYRNKFLLTDSETVGLLSWILKDLPVNSDLDSKVQPFSTIR